MKYLITGITGFLGPHLANKLIKEGHQVFGLVRINNGRENDIRDVVCDETYSKIEFVYGDLTDFRMIDKIFIDNIFDGVFHLAAQTHPPTSFTDPIKTWEWNVMGSINLITAISDRQPICKLVFCSTVEVYGNEGIDGRKIKEDNVFLPANPYGASKAAIDLYLQERIKNKQLNCVIVRPFCFTGPRRGSKFSISSDAIQVARMMLGKQEKVLKIGNLDTVRIVADVRDVANAFFLIMTNEKSSGNIYNICSGTPYKMRHYTETLLKLSGLKDVKLEIEPKFWRPIDIQHQDGDSSKLEEELGWSPQYKIDETLKDLLDYWVNKIKI
jgi:GDP-4-dehydro-6-deoxy-D-mannose reductase